MKFGNLYSVFIRTVLVFFLSSSPLLTSQVLAQDLSIFESRRPLALNSETKTHRDFYINGGVEHGVKKNMVLTVKRRLTLYDSYKANSPTEMMVDVGRVKIIHAQKDLSVARYYSSFSRENRAILQNDFIMVGDKIDLSSAVMASQLKKKSASRPPKAEPKKPSAQSQKTSEASLQKQFSKADFSSQSPESEQEPLEVKSLE